MTLNVSQVEKVDVKVKKAYDIRCRLLYSTMVPGMMSVSVIVCEI